MIELKNEKLTDLLSGITLVDYYADWCGPCQMLGIELEELKDINIIKVDVDQHHALAEEKNIMTIPFVEIYKDQELITSFNGFKTKSELEDMLKEI